MDMLQLFASPAGRALLSSREDRQHRRSSTSTSSLTREPMATTSKRKVITASTSTGSSSSSSGTVRRFSPFGSGSASAPTSPPARQRKNSDELYKEAVEILGLTCTLSDSCRCIDCQVGMVQFYFVKY